MPKPAFRYTHYDLSEQRVGTVIEITLSAIANVRLMTASNFQRFTETLKHQFVGGVAKKSPIRLTIPESGHWHLVVDMEGHNGLAESSVKMIDKPTAPRIQKAATASADRRPLAHSLLRSRRSFAHQSSLLRISRSKPRSAGS